MGGGTRRHRTAPGIGPTSRARCYRHRTSSWLRPRRGGHRSRPTASASATTSMSWMSGASSMTAETFRLRRTTRSAPDSSQKTPASHGCRALPRPDHAVLERRPTASRCFFVTLRCLSSGPFELCEEFAGDVALRASGDLATHGASADASGNVIDHAETAEGRGHSGRLAHSVVGQIALARSSLLSGCRRVRRSKRSDASADAPLRRRGVARPEEVDGEMPGDASSHTAGTANAVPATTWTNPTAGRPIEPSRASPPKTSATAATAESSAAPSH